MTNFKTARGHYYTFPAIRGIQAGKPFYVAMCPLHLIPRIFIYDDEGVLLPPEARAQRTLNTARIPEMARYIVEQKDSYVFSSLTASVNGEILFEPTTDKDDNVGHMKIPMSAEFILNDGQHRRAAIEEALKQDRGIANETISVVFFPDQGLKRSQQMFADLNRHAMKPTKSLSILYDYSDPLSGLAKKIGEEVPEFRGLVELEKTTIPNRSLKLFTLSSIYEGTAVLLGKGKKEPLDTDEEKFAVLFWKTVAKNMPDWGRAQKKEVTTSELRQTYIHSHGVALQALGHVGHSLKKQFPKDWKNLLQGLRDIRWERSNTKDWEGRAMISGRLSKTGANVRLTAAHIKTKLGVELTDEEVSLERCRPKAAELVAA